MKNFFLFTILFCVSAAFCFAQAAKNPVRTASPKTVELPTVTEFSEAEWKILTDALQAEDWKKSAAIAAQYIEKIKTDNDKKQLAQLRYFYLYALAGKILAAVSVKVPIDTEAMWNELDTAIGNFTGKEFVLPPRAARADCKEVLNYVCAVKDNGRALRITATNKEGTEIHSFEYVAFDTEIPFEQFADKPLFLGGRLKRAEFNQDMSKLWVMRMIFEKGFVRVIMPEER